MFLQKLTAAALVLVLAAGVASAVLTPAPPPPAARPLPAPTVAAAEVLKPTPQPAPQPAGPGRLLVWTETKYVFYTPDGKELGSLPGHPDKRIMTHPVLSPDGKRVAFLAYEDPPTDDEGFSRQHVFVRTTDGAGDGVKIPINAASLAWTPDGKRLVAGEFLRAKELKDAGFVTWSIDPDTGDKINLDLPRPVHVFTTTPDGKGFVGVAYDFDEKKAYLARVTTADKAVTKLTELRNEGPNPRVSPDGGKILFQDFDPDEKPAKDDHHLMRLFVFDPKAGTRERLADVPLNALVRSHCWSPDGKKVAYVWKQTMPGVPLALNTENMNDPKINTETETFLVIADADGKNPRTVLSRKAPSAPQITLGDLDWR